VLLQSICLTLLPLEIITKLPHFSIQSFDNQRHLPTSTRNMEWACDNITTCRTITYEHYLRMNGVQEVAGSNPVAPTSKHRPVQHLADWPVSFRANWHENLTRKPASLDPEAQRWLAHERKIRHIKASSGLIASNKDSISLSVRARRFRTFLA